MQITRVHACTGHRAAVYALARGRDDRHFITAAGDGWVVEWNLDDLETGKLIASTETQLFSLCALPDGHTLLAGNMNGGLHWIVRDQPEQNRNILHHKKGVYDILALGKYVFTAGGDGLFTRWDVENARSLESIQLSSQALRAIAYSDKNHEIAVGASDHNIYFLDADTLELKSTIGQAHTNSVFALAWSPDQSMLLSGGRDAWLRIWEQSSDHTPVNLTSPANAHPPSTVGRLPSPQTPNEAAHLFTLNHIAFSPDGLLFATASRDKTIKIWDGRSFELLKVIDTMRHGGHINSVNRLLWVADCLVSASDDRSAMVWRIDG